MTRNILLLENCSKRQHYRIFRMSFYPRDVYYTRKDGRGQNTFLHLMQDIEINNGHQHRDHNYITRHIYYNETRFH